MKQYIGITTRYRRRMYEHKRAPTPFGKALRKYNESAFCIRLFKFDTIEEAYELEEVLVREKQVLSDWSYNQCLGGKGSILESLTNPNCKLENRIKRSNLMKTDYNPMSNKKARENHKKSMNTEEYKEFHREKTRERMKDPAAKAKALEGTMKANAARARKVLCEDVCFTAVVDAANHLGISRSALRGRIKSTTPKYDNFRYID